MFFLFFFFLFLLCAALPCTLKKPDVPVKVSAAAVRAEVQRSVGQRLKSLKKKKKRKRKTAAAATQLIRGESFIQGIYARGFLPLKI